MLHIQINENSMCDKKRSLLLNKSIYEMQVKTSYCLIKLKPLIVIDWDPKFLMTILE